jgi:hypothetical protein
MVGLQNAGGVRTQFFLRGFNLGFGTDFAFFSDGVPLNMPSHVHGQGYTDLNFLIPELIRGIDYGKGPYYPEVGDFSSVGYADINTFNVLPFSFAKVEVGQFHHKRFVFADCEQLGQGTLIYALEARHYDGPWTVAEHLRQLKGFAKYTVADECGGFAISLTAYDTSYSSHEPIPLRAVSEGIVPFFGVLDPSDGGVTMRYSVNGQWWQKWEDGSVTKANIYGVRYRLNSFENESFFIDDPVLGDQIQEKDVRYYTGINIAHEMPGELCGLKTKNTIGFQFRQDWIPVNNHDGTSSRSFVNPIIDDNIQQFSGGLFFKNETRWLEKLRTVAGFRGDYYEFTVDAHDTPENSGNTKANIFSPKGSIILGPWADTEFYLNAGMAFHSNDAKGVLTRVDPETGEPVTPVPGLIQSRGAEIGVRSQAIPGLVSTVTYWNLELDSELVFRGDSGTTEPLPASKRSGIELANSYKVNGWLTVFADYADSSARFAQFNPAGSHVPLAIEEVFDGGLTLRAENGLYTTWTVLFLGPRALVEDNSVRSRSTTVVNMETGWERPRFKVAVQILNVLDSRDHDFDFFFTSRLPGEPLTGVPDVMFRPLEPFNLRVYAMYKW